MPQPSSLQRHDFATEPYPHSLRVPPCHPPNRDTLKIELFRAHAPKELLGWDLLFGALGLGFRMADYIPNGTSFISTFRTTLT